MLEIKHHYSHKTEWFSDASKQIGATLLNSKISVFPQNIAQGSSYYLPIIDGISAVLFDAKFKKDVVINRHESDDDLYILHFDLSNTINPLNLINSKKESINSKFKSGFSVLHTSLGSTFRPKKNQRVYVLRILIEQKKLINYISEKNNSLKNIEKKILFYNTLNANNKVLINSLKEKSMFDVGFDLYFKGISLKILANFIDTYSHPVKDEIRKIEQEAIQHANDYMLNNLYENFPGILFLSRLAKMSKTRYKTCFNKTYKDSPYNFFNKQKMILSKQLLSGGNFSSTNEISKILNFSKHSYFISKYKNYFGRDPLIDLKRKNIINNL
ncbi:AraC-type DNA-binding protein [Flavobacterium resistens]|uniref:AraC-type DNA-binding protein n=1 Tax=Flavobacterium resistens TaxID=443612 RepID=A0A521D8C4_9FLAO|nr:AraC family transcriptional regulator [Flavobacterium resistens]MRX70385.1 hypothetical protein [Flavobacterium resistens]SMO67954.1 AraC-type DNA-binding protein [Flavobacterium resistens]